MPAVSRTASGLCEWHWSPTSNLNWVHRPATDVIPEAFVSIVGRSCVVPAYPRRQRQHSGPHVPELAGSTQT